MAQGTSPAYDTSQDDPSQTGEDAPQGKTSLLSKLKHKTHDKTHKLKSKLKGSSKTGEDSNDTNDDNEDPFSGSDYEPEAPVHNAVSGVTQPEYGRQSTDTEKSDPIKGHEAAPAQNFPGNFTGVVDDQTDTASSLSDDFQGLSTNDKDESTETQPAAESASADEKDQTKETSTPGGGDYDQKGVTSEQSQQTGDNPPEAAKTWSQWAAEKVGYAKDTTTEKVGAAKDTAAANVPTTAEGKPIHKAAFDTTAEKAAAAKETLAAQVPDRSGVPSDPAQQTYFQKATGGVYGAKDKLYTSTQPGEHDKALSQKVTETVGNLPATLKTSLGFGGKSGAASPTTTPGSSDAPLSSSTEESPGAPPQSPGLVSRITGLFGAKKPADESTPHSEPNITETGPSSDTPVSESSNLS